MNKKGFTLVELLVVIILLALLIILTMTTVLSAFDAQNKNIFSMQLQKFNTDINTAYSDARIDQGALAPTCYLVKGLKQANGYEGYIIIDPVEGKTDTINVYNKDYVYNAGITALVSQKGKAISDLEASEYTTRKNAIDAYIANPSNGCIEANDVFED